MFWYTTKGSAIRAMKKQRIRDKKLGVNLTPRIDRVFHKNKIYGIEKTWKLSWY